MTFDLFLSFDGKAREAAEFYAKVFQSEVQQMMTYAKMPGEYTVPEADKDKIVYCHVPVFGHNLMLCDVPAGMPLVVGTNFNPTLGTDDKAEIRRLFAALQEDGGEVGMELQQTFWSELYGMVTDKFGITWQFSYAARD